jgi:hypothetical protein
VSGTSKFDPADYLDTPELAATYLNEALATDDATFIAAAISDIARAKGIDGPRFDGGALRLDDVCRLIAACDLRIAVKSVTGSGPPPP